MRERTRETDNAEGYRYRENERCVEESLRGGCQHTKTESQMQTQLQTYTEKKEGKRERVSQIIVSGS